MGNGGSTGPLLAEEPPDTKGVVRQESGWPAGANSKALLIERLDSRNAGDVPQVPVDVAEAYHGFSVSQSKLGAPRKHQELQGWKGEYETHHV